MEEKFIESFTVRTMNIAPIFHMLQSRRGFFFCWVTEGRMAGYCRNEQGCKTTESKIARGWRWKNMKLRHTFNQFILRVLIPLIHMGTATRNLRGARTTATKITTE